MYKIKQIPEDFVVNEISGIKPMKKGDYGLFTLKKTNWTTIKAIREIAKKLNVSNKRFSVAGIKDRRAITKQMVAVYGIGKEQLKSIHIKDIQLKFLGKYDNNLGLGDLEENQFKIVVRNIKKSGIKTKTIPNYFDDQRFGGLRPNNHIVGKHLIKKNYEEAIKEFLTNPFDTESADDRNARLYLEKNWGDFSKALDYYPRYLFHERTVLDHLMKNNKDYVGAFKRINKHILTMFVHAYQSLIWNTTLGEILRQKSKKYKEVDYACGKLIFLEKYNLRNFKIPIVGFSTELKDNDVDNIIKKILEKEGLKQMDFVNKQIPALTSEGLDRDAFIKLRSLILGKLEKDELNKSKKKQKISFALGKGSYATVVIKALFLD